MKSSRYLTIFVATSMLLAGVFVGCGTTRNKPAPTSDDGAAAAIADIASVDGISEAQAGRLYRGGHKSLDALVDTDPGDVVRLTDLGPDEAVAAIKSVKKEVEKRADEARAKAENERLEAIADLTSVEGIDEGNATAVYDAPENGFKSLEALSKAKPTAIQKAKLAKDIASAKAIAKSAGEIFAEKGRLQAAEYKAGADKAKAAADEAKADADKAAAVAADKAEAAKAAAQKAKDLKAAAEAARALAPTPPILPRAQEPNSDDSSGSEGN